MNPTAEIPGLHGPGARSGARTIVKWVIVSVLVVAGSLVFWQQWLKHQWPRKWGEVVPGQVYRSGQISRWCIERTLRDNQIKRVIFMSIDKANRPDVQAEQAACLAMGIERINLPLDGRGGGDIEMYVRAVKLIVESQKRGERVLVHCHAGAQRTGGVVAAYRVLVEGKSSSEAYDELESYGHDPEDNPFLVKYLNENMALLARRLVEEGVIARLPERIPVLGPVASAGG